MEFLNDFLVDWGYFGLFIAAFLAGSILPFASEVILIVLLRMGLDPTLCIAVATVGNSLGGMTCYWIGACGNSRWIARLGVKERQVERAKRFLAGRGAVMGFFAFLPTIGEAMALVLGMMRSNIYLTAVSMFVGKLLRYIIIYLTAEGISNL